ncbi:MAG: GAF domain-containing protein, partial [Acidimicrobiales bacterium]
MQRVAGQALTLIEPAEGVLIALLDHAAVLTYVCGAGSLADQVGFTISLQGSLSGLAMNSGRIVATDDARTDPRVDAEACRKMHVVSSVCVPLMRDGFAFGVLNVSSSVPHGFDETDAAKLGELAEFVSVAVAASADLDRVAKCLLDPSLIHLSGSASEITSQFVTNVLRPQTAEHSAIRQRIERVLNEKSFSMVYQP